MTTFGKKKTFCTLCGNENEFTVIGSTNTFFGSPDLDTRPPEMMRSTIFTWVQRCSKCGYCHSDVSKSRPGSESVVNGLEYRRQLNDQTYPELVRSFLCKAIIDHETNDYAGATWALIHAAWACDDADRPEEAATCRCKATDMLVAAEEHGVQVAGQKGASIAILVDLLRRSGRVEDARKAIEECRTVIAEEIIIRILDFQSALIERGDASCHRTSEVLGKDK